MSCTLAIAPKAAGRAVETRAHNSEATRRGAAWACVSTVAVAGRSSLAHGWIAECGSGVAIFEMATRSSTSYDFPPSTAEEAMLLISHPCSSGGHG